MMLARYRAGDSGRIASAGGNRTARLTAATAPIPAEAKASASAFSAAPLLHQPPWRGRARWSAIRRGRWTVDQLRTHTRRSEAEILADRR